tara:strand:- start:341 stop:490 length:150 start_codon:yes stop_codon:yes gene_type:complete
MKFIIEIFNFIKVRKKFIILPALFLILILGSLIVISQGSAVAPFIYTLF